MVRESDLPSHASVTGVVGTTSTFLLSLYTPQLLLLVCLADSVLLLSVSLDYKEAVLVEIDPQAASKGKP